MSKSKSYLKGSRNIISKDNKPSPVANREAGGGQSLYNQLYLGWVKDNSDIQRMGRCRVYIPDFGGDPADESNWVLASYTSPLAGASDLLDGDETGPEASRSQTSYGIWCPPPDINNKVIIAFLNGDPLRGVIMGMMYDNLMNYMVPGTPGGSINTGDGVVDYGIAQEYNKQDSGVNPDQPIRPKYSKLNDQLKKQGLDKDKVRAVNTSSARRESPSFVSGWKTKSGHQLVFDDHTDEDYIRLRTARGAQILLNDKHGNIYINSRDGNSWIEMTLDGRIDVFSEKTVNVHSNENIDFYANNDVNIDAGRNVNIRANGTAESNNKGTGNIYIESKKNIYSYAQDSYYQTVTKDYNIKSKNNYITTSNSYHVSSGSDIQQHAGKLFHVSSGWSYTIKASGPLLEQGSVLHLNPDFTLKSSSPVSATEAEKAKVYTHTKNTKIKSSITSVVAEHEPWKAHYIEGNTLKDSRGAAQVYGPQSEYSTNVSSTSTSTSSSYAKTPTSDPIEILPVSEVEYNEDYVEYDDTDCLGFNTIMNHTLSDQGVRHILQDTDYSPYTTSDGTIGYGTTDSGSTSKYPEGLTEAEAVKAAKNDLFNSTQTTKKLLGQNSTQVSQSQFDSLVSLVHHAGYSTVSKYTNIPDLINSNKLSEVGNVINQVVPQVSSLSSQIDSLSNLFNLCDYGTLGNTSSTSIQSSSLSSTYDDYETLSASQKRQIAGVAIKTNNIDTLYNTYPSDYILQQTVSDAENDYSGFKKHRYFITPTTAASTLDELQGSSSNTTDTTATYTSNMSSCEDLIDVTSFSSSFSLSDNFTLKDFMANGSINGVLPIEKNEVVCNLRFLVNNIFEPMINAGIDRNNIVIRSGIRNSTIDNQHSLGKAVDFYLKDYGISILDLAIWLETNTPDVLENITLINCGDLTPSVHIVIDRLATDNLSKYWKPTNDKNIYVKIDEFNKTYGGGWASFEEMKQVPQKSKISYDWAFNII